MILDIIKYFLYDIALNIFFDSIENNFPKEKITAIIGQHYSKILDSEMNECYYDCIIIPIKELSYYEDLVSDYLDEDEDANELVAFGVLFKKFGDLSNNSIEEYSSYAEVHFEKEEISNLIFYK